MNYPAASRGVSDPRLLRSPAQWEQFELRLMQLFVLARPALLFHVPSNLRLTPTHEVVQQQRDVVAPMYVLTLLRAHPDRLMARQAAGNLTPLD